MESGTEQIDEAKRREALQEIAPAAYFGTT
jgi:hypothetical protein